MRALLGVALLALVISSCRPQPAPPAPLSRHQRAKRMCGPACRCTTTARSPAMRCAAIVVSIAATMP